MAMREAGGRLPAAALEVLRRAAPSRAAAGARAGRGGWSPRGEGAAPSCMPPATRSTRCVGAPAATTAAQIGVDDSFHGGSDEVRHDLMLLDARTAAD